MKKILLIGLSCLLFIIPLYATPAAQEIIEKADQFRGFQNLPFTFKLKITSHRPDKPKRSSSLQVEVKAGNTLVQFLAPKRDKGRAMLFSGRDLWLHIPKTRKIIRISPAQRLMGEASNGDTAGANFADDYSAILTGEAEINGQKCFHLSLKAVDQKITYGRIEYWVNQKTYKPVKSEHYAISGKLLKVALYKSFTKVGKGEKLNKLLLINPLFKGRYTWMLYSKYQQKDLPDSRFRKENLNRL
ncbi:MAG: outer membrane lipoprotein-sorting protein [Deltaproteobacteria bacterium]|nr:outer membrane lipoprotein-sorting protein [Deltaproteobacteria bacterium]